jgi:hypothetical protein
MPTIGYIGSVQIRIYYDDHGVPHFHAVSPDFDFKSAMEDCSIISGNGQLRGRDVAAIRAWEQRHRDALFSNWRLARDGKPLQDIKDWGCYTGSRRLKPPPITP